MAGTTWVACGQFIIDTGIDDPAWGSGQFGYSYAAKVRITKAYLQAGSDVPPVTFRFSLNTRIAINVPVTFTANSQSQTISDGARRIYIIVECWTDQIVGGTPIEIHGMEWRLERLS